LIRQVHSGLHERCAHTLALEIIPDGHANLGGMPAARAMRRGVDIQLADHLGLAAGHQANHAVRRLGQALAPRFDGGEGHLQCAPNNFGARKDLVQGDAIRWFGVSDQDGHVLQPAFAEWFRLRRPQ